MSERRHPGLPSPPPLPEPAPLPRPGVLDARLALPRAGQPCGSAMAPRLCTVSAAARRSTCDSAASSHALAPTSRAQQRMSSPSSSSSLSRLKPATSISGSSWRQSGNAKSGRSGAGRYTMCDTSGTGTAQPPAAARGCAAVRCAAPLLDDAAAVMHVGAVCRRAADHGNVEAHAVCRKRPYQLADLGCSKRRVTCHKRDHVHRAPRCRAAPLPHREQRHLKRLRQPHRAFHRRQLAKLRQLCLVSRRGEQNARPASSAQHHDQLFGLGDTAIAVIVAAAVHTSATRSGACTVVCGRKWSEGRVRRYCPVGVRL
eukprot:365679-Chlamydomonas_euryale.AAC.1